MVNKGNDPQMAEQFRLVKYDNLPRIMIVTQHFFFWDNSYNDSDNYK